MVSKAKEQLLTTEEFASEVKKYNRKIIPIEDYLEYDFDLSAMFDTGNYKSFRKIKEDLNSLIRTLTSKECFDLVVELEQEKNLPLKLKKKAVSHLLDIEKIVNSFFVAKKIHNGNELKFASVNEINSVAENVDLFEGNIEFAKGLLFNPEISEYEISDDTVVMIGDEFSLSGKVNLKEKYKTIFKMNFCDGIIIKDIDQLKFSMQKVMGSEINTRGIESNIFRFELLISLGAGKYKVTIDEDNVSERIDLANSVYELINDYFSKNENYLMDLLHISTSSKLAKYDFYNEHELYYVAKKYIHDFSKEF